MSADVLLVIAALIPAMVLHELAHGLVAWRLGDDTAKSRGRLTLNPLKHVDRFGSVLLPLLLAAGQILAFGQVRFLYGWAKPVPVNFSNLRWGRYRDPRRLMGVVALAGPAANFAQAIFGGLALHGGMFTDFWLFYIEINLVIGLFNLTPLLPLDGGRIVLALLPLKLARGYARLEKYGLLLIFVVLVGIPLLFPGGFDPVNMALNKILPLAENIVLSLTGNGNGS
ncbi:site-2 protease family protein [Acidocella sp.]|uniref:site-2 protease family protein n=1 Tax=Acidocella sp. TaxID=50710 RepID=UPI0026196C63|nr:site-2 protease family protein [Acidocella sp.]